MEKVLTAGAVSPESAAAVFEESAAFLAAHTGSSVLALRVTGIYEPCRSWRADAGAGRRLRAAAAGLEDAARSFRTSGGLLVALSDGVTGGPFLEAALMAPVHVMTEGAAIAVPGLYDAYVPSAGVWGRIVGRCRAGRAAGILLARARLDAHEALAAGLCDLVGDGKAALDDLGASRGTASAAALRLVSHLGDHAPDVLTARQSAVIEAASFALALASEEPAEGIAAFFEGRPPRFATGPALRTRETR